ncbi:MAG: helix-turn-helix domain-containing protein [Rhodospirillaceae bacterium]|jgi:Cys-tRNA synthase (O-phospho-L-seryl-tRNA:Cys-tRNA synthase)
MPEETPYVRALAMKDAGASLREIGEALGVSRQYAHQLLQRGEAPAAAGVKHGTVVMLSGGCTCSACAAMLATIQAAVPEVVKRLRAGASLVETTRATGFAVARYVTATRGVATPPEALAQLVAVFDETAPLRPRGRPKGPAATLSSKDLAA